MSIEKVNYFREWSNCIAMAASKRLGVHSQLLGTRLQSSSREIMAPVMTGKGPCVPSSCCLFSVSLASPAAILWPCGIRESPCLLQPRTSTPESSVLWESLHLLLGDNRPKFMLNSSICWGCRRHSFSVASTLSARWGFLDHLPQQTWVAGAALFQKLP